jgi:hypothetical protein
MSSYGLYSVVHHRNKKIYTDMQIYFLIIFDTLNNMLLPLAIVKDKDDV